MSKVGKLPVAIPKGVKVELKDNRIDVTGPKGTLSQDLHKDMIIKVEGEEIVVTRPSDNKQHRSLHGLTRVLIQNMVTGVTQGYSITLQLVGVGYRSEKQGKLLVLNLGFSHPILFRPPEGVEIDVNPKENTITVSGIDKQMVGQSAALIRRFRPPEPYKGKGVRYLNEQVRRKAGKAVGK
jgi:large subunit ribosomal protein L6